MNYSQHGQETWVLETLKNKKNGYFIDLGAGDWKNLSNTYLLESEYDWRGILIEPSDCYFEGLVTHRKSTCVKELVADSIKTVIYDSSDSDDFDYNMRAGIHDTNKNKDPKWGFKPLLLQTTTLSAILDRYSAPLVIDYLSLDVEGANMKFCWGPI
jgi:hypothetical protein